MVSAKYRGEIVHFFWNYFADRILKLLKEYSSKDYDEIWKMEDLNEPTSASLSTLMRHLPFPHSDI